MEWDVEQLAELMLKYFTDQANESERALVDEFLAVPGHREKVAEIFSRQGFEKEKALWDLADEREKANRERILSLIEAHDSDTTIFTERRSIRRRLLAAASVVLILCSGYLLTRRFHTRPSESPSTVANVDLLPAGHHAILTLSNGKRLMLDAVPNGQVARDAGAIVQKRAGGRLDYVLQNTTTTTAPAWNTLTTPRGETYEVDLPDHSTVILNSESSLTYPTSFASTGPRVVKMTGEAYFDVHHDVKRPFHVQVARGTIEALGTSFNVNAYADEQAVRATLLEGRVRVVGAEDSILLRPGQQAVMKTGLVKVLSGVDTSAVVGWKNGDFVFDSTPLNEVMRQLGRWYNVQVSYDTLGEQPSFTAEISRNRPASEVLKVLEVSGYRFTIVGKDRIEAVKK